MKKRLISIIVALTLMAGMVGIIPSIVVKAGDNTHSSINPEKIYTFEVSGTYDYDEAYDVLKQLNDYRESY